MDFTTAEFRLPERLAILQLKDEPYVGAELLVKTNLRLEPLLELRELGEKAQEDPSALSRMREIFLPNLVKWNLTTEAGPLPTDASGWDQLEIALQIAIIKVWIEACVGVPSPLDEQPDDTTESGD